MNTLFYIRRAKYTMFLLPCIAVGVDVMDGRPFLEIGWLFWAVGIVK